MSWDGADVIIIEIKCTINLMCLNHPKIMPPTPGLWKNCLAWNWSLVPNRLGSAVLRNFKKIFFSSKESQKIGSLGPAWNSHSYMGFLSHHSTILTIPSSWSKMAPAAPPNVTLYELLCEPLGFPGGSDGKESACNMRDLGSILGLRRSPGEGNGYPLQHSCLKITFHPFSWPI